MQPKVSIIVPTYNVEKYLAECMETIIAQTLKDIEIICVDDGSTDNSGTILDSYAAKDNRIKVIHKENGGYGKAMNVGLDNASGEYIGIVEPDDKIELNMYETLYLAAEKNNVDFVKGDLYYWWSKDNRSVYTSCIKNPNLYNCIINDLSNPDLSPSTVANWAGIYKKEFLSKYNIRHSETPGASYQDQGFYYQVIFNASSAYYINQPFYWYRQDNMLSSVNNKNKIYCIFDEYDIIEKFLENLKDKEKFYKVFSTKKFNSCLWNYKRIDSKYKPLFYSRLCKSFSRDYYEGRILRNNFNLENWDKIKKCIIDYEKNNEVPVPTFKEKIPVVLASDQNYAKQMYVTIISILENKNYNTYYDFFLLVPKKFSLDITSKFYKLKSKYSGFNINFVEMGKTFSYKKMQIAHITSPTYYRLKIAHILPAEYNKAIYLDVDTIVLQDLSELYNIDLEDNYIAGVKAAGYILSKNNREYYNSIGLLDISSYINAGVTLWNLKQLRKDSMSAKLSELAQNDYSSMDQDIINVAFQGRIKILPIKFNLMTKYKDLFSKNILKREQYYDIYPENEIIEAINNPVIIHYADKIKPWNSEKTILRNVWLKYEKQADFQKCNSFMEKFFSVKNKDTRKVITIFGLKLKVKSKKLEERKRIVDLETKVKKLNKKFKKQKIKINNQSILIQEQASKVEEQNQKIEEQYINLSQQRNQLNQLNKNNEHLNTQITENNSAIFDLYLDSLNNEKDNRNTNIQNILQKITQAPEYLPVDSSHNYLNILLNIEEFSYERNKFNNDDILISWETARWNSNLDILFNAIKTKKKVLFIGDSFLRSIDTFANKNAEKQYRKGISFGIDDSGYYYDGSRSTRMERMLNDKNLIITEEQKLRARNCINKIVETHLTKYNHQPIYEPNIGREGVEKILVVDQSYGDMSIAKGLANDYTFKKMLDDAIIQNPNADIIIKTHPDTIAGTGGYYKGLEPHDNIYTMTEPINPISLIKYCNKVYVCTTQLGFEALMCGKEVHVYGMPFYAGWGLTQDMQKCERRTNTRTLEEIFYIAYIMYSYYVNPDKKCRCEIEEAMDYLLNLREEYLSVKSK